MEGYLIPPTAPPRLLHRSTCSTQRYGSMLWSIVLYLLNLHRTSQTWRPSGTYFRRDHRISGYGRPCVLLHPLRSSTLNTLWHGRRLWHIVVYLAGPHLTPSGPHRPGDRLGPTSGGSIGIQGMGDLVHPAQQYTEADVRMTSTRLHVA